MKTNDNLQFHPELFYFLLFMVMLFPFIGCSGPEDSSDSTGTGTASFSIQWPDAPETDDEKWRSSSVVSDSSTNFKVTA